MSYLESRCEALERKVELLESAIKKSWGFIKYDLPLSLEIEITTKNFNDKRWNREAFKPLIDATLQESVKLFKEKPLPVHYTVITRLVEQNHKDVVSKYNRPQLDGKVRDLAQAGWLVRVGKGTYFMGPKMKNYKGE